MCVFTQSCPTLCHPWTVAHQAPLSMGFLYLIKNTGSGWPFLLQGIFPTQGSNTHLVHCRRIFCHPGSIKYIHNTVKLLCRTFSTCKSESLSPYPLITTVLLSGSMNLFPALLSKYSFLSLPSASVQFWLIMPLRKREPSVIFTEVL